MQPIFNGCFKSTSVRGSATEPYVEQALNLLCHFAGAPRILPRESRYCNRYFAIVVPQSVFASHQIAKYTHKRDENNRMRLTSAIFVGLAASVQADISVDEIAGQRLLSKARKLDSSGQAVSQGWSYGYSQQAQNQNYWNYGTDDQQQQQNQGGDDGYGQYYQNLKSGNSNGNSTQTDRWGNSASENYDVSWMSGYSIKFSGCAVENGKSSSGSGSTKRLLAKFKLCPSTSSCTRCKNVSPQQL